jgi:hypothetical protein
MRSNFPAVVSADTLKKWGIAPNNENYIINVLRFLNLIDEDGKKKLEFAKAFLEPEDEAFQKKFEPIVKRAYGDLFKDYGDTGWTQPKSKLVSFFRTSDNTSAIIGDRQALTFQTLAAFAGHQPENVERTVSTTVRGAPTKKRGSKSRAPERETVTKPEKPSGEKPHFTIRVEVNLPVTDDQAVYDKIFASLRANLLNG